LCAINRHPNWEMLGGLGGGKRTPFKVAAGSFASPGEDSGHCCIALRPIKRGECVLFEAPCVMTRGVSAEVSDGPSAMQADEWQLTYELLVAGKGIPWADSYVRTPRAPEVESAAAVSWLQEATGATAETVLAVFRTVANNAFALDTFVLRIKYGAAFFELAAFMNHSCDPNCLSLRMGGNMAIFAARDIASGEELNHSYVPPCLLLAAEEVRGKHLHFVCACARCRAERAAAAEGVASLGSRLGFPPDYFNTAAGKGVAAFKLAAALADKFTHSADDCERILDAGDEVLHKEHWAFFSAHPVAALDVAGPYLAAAFGALLSGQPGLLRARPRRNGLRAAARLFLEASAGMRAAAGTAGAGSAAAGTAAGAAAGSAAAEAPPPLPGPVLEQLVAVGCVQLYLVGGGLPRRELVPLLLGGLRSICTAYGGSLDCLREDLSCLASLAGAGGGEDGAAGVQPLPSLESIVRAVGEPAAAAAGAGGAAGAGAAGAGAAAPAAADAADAFPCTLPDGAFLDECAYCAAKEEGKETEKGEGKETEKGEGRQKQTETLQTGGAAGGHQNEDRESRARAPPFRERFPFRRCAQCRLVKYCCKGHQAADWQLHQRFCSAPQAAALPRVWGGGAEAAGAGGGGEQG
jgi:hypothetical protein